MSDATNTVPSADEPQGDNANVDAASSASSGKKRRLPVWAIVLIVLGVVMFALIVVLGALGAIASSVFVNQQDKGKTMTSQSDAKTVATFMETYFTQYQQYPVTLDEALQSQDAYVLAPSPGSVVSVATSNETGTFKVCVFNVNSQSQQSVVYDSGAGGLQPNVEGADQCNAVGSWDPSQTSFTLFGP